MAETAVNELSGERVGKLTTAVRGGLERRGVEPARILLATAGGPAEGSIVPGLTDLNQKWISRADAEQWLGEQDATREQTRWRKEAVLLKWTIASTIVAGIGAFAAVFAAIEGLGAAK